MGGSIFWNFTYLNCFEMFGDVLNIWSGLERIKKTRKPHDVLSSEF